MVVQRLWKDEEVKMMVPTVLRLRRMRSAAVSKRSKAFLHIKKAWYNYFNFTADFYSPQEALRDAQRLANESSAFYTSIIANKGNKKKKFLDFKNTLNDKSKQYRLYPPVTYANTSTKQVIRDSIISQLRTMHIDDEYYMNWEFTVNNNFGVSSIDELLEADIGIISPLSGDYFSAMIFSNYLELTRGKGLNIVPIALSKDLLNYEILLDEDGEFPFQDKSEIGIFLDVSDTGNTARATYNIASRIYSDKIVHEPNSKPKKFEQSEKIKRYWNEYEASLEN